jgi:DNA (cytosine-5)-methyltransferase 1
MKVLDLFSGIGGFSLGLERAGMETVAFCEIDKKCRLVLKKHWPDVPQYEDIKKLTWARLQKDGIEEIDLICGGFPCQDISPAGKKEGINGERSGLWSEFFRLISDIRPKKAVLENSSNLFRGGYGAWIRQLFGQLAEIGYNAEGHIIPAAAIGANHQRERAWVVAHSEGNTIENSVYSQIERDIFFKSKPRGNTWGPVPGTYWEEAKPRIFEMDDGVPGWVGEASQYGNAVVPQIPELIGRAILKAEND